MTQDEIKKLEENTDIVSLISTYGVPLTKQGKNYKGCCPFHNEKTPSFMVSPGKNMFNCFGCHIAGGPIKFLQQKLVLSYPEAIKELCKFHNIEYKDNFTKKENPNNKYFKIMETASKFYNAYLLNDVSSKPALEYLAGRGITKDIIDRYEIGLAPNTKDTLYKLLKKATYNELDCSDLGLIDKNERGYHDIFVNRITFPIKDEFGNVLGFSAREFSGDKNQPKYINSKETRIFKKGDALFNINNAKPEIVKKHRVILHEGQMDVIAADKAGFGEAICSMGTAITENQAKLLKRLTDSIIICFDGDKAGINSSVKAINLFKRLGFQVHLVLLPLGLDPDEYVSKYGKEEYAKYFEGHIIDSNEYIFQTTIYNKNIDDKEVFEEVKNEIFNMINNLSSEIEKDKYLNKFSDVLQIELNSIKVDFDKYRNTHSSSNVTFVDDGYSNMPVDSYYPIPDSYYDEASYNQNVVIDAPIEVKSNKNKEKAINNLCEIRLFRHATVSRSLAKQIDSKICDDMFAFTEINRKLWEKLIYEYYETFSEFNEATFIKMLTDEEMDQYLLINNKLKNDRTIYNQEDLDKCILMIKKMNKKLSDKKLIESVKKIDDVSEQTRMLDRLFKNKKNENK